MKLTAKYMFPTGRPGTSRPASIFDKLLVAMPLPNREYRIVLCTSSLVGLVVLLFSSNDREKERERETYQRSNEAAQEECDHVCPGRQRDILFQHNNQTEHEADDKYDNKPPPR